MEKQRPEERLTKRQRRELARSQAKKYKVPNPGRRRLLKMMLAGGAVAAAGGVGYLVKEAVREKTLKEKVLAFTWKDAEDKEKLKAFTEDLINGYLQLTKTTRIKKEDFNEENLQFFTKESEFLKRTEQLNPKYAIEHQRGYADYKAKTIFINTEALKKDSEAVGSNAGLDIVQALWHEIGHLDIEPRKEGKYIGNPQALLRSTVPNMPAEIIRSYHGGLVESDNYTDYQRFEEVWVETLTARLMVEELGLEEIVSSSEYNINGADILYPLTKDIPMQTLYSMHATSDFEGFAELIGGKLPGTRDPFLKGEQLFIAIHKNNPQLIRQTGALDLRK